MGEIKSFINILIQFVIMLRRAHLSGQLQYRQSSENWYWAHIHRCVPLLKSPALRPVSINLSLSWRYTYLKQERRWMDIFKHTSFDPMLAQYNLNLKLGCHHCVSLLFFLGRRWDKPHTARPFPFFCVASLRHRCCIWDLSVVRLSLTGTAPGSPIPR